jgi:hypothetical protein
MIDRNGITSLTCRNTDIDNDDDGYQNITTKENLGQNFCCSTGKDFQCVSIFTT